MYWIIRYIMSLLLVAVGALLIFALSGCSVKYEDMGGELDEQGKRTLVLPDGRGCTGKLRYTGGGYAAVHYNFNCDDGRIYVNLTNAEVE